METNVLEEFQGTMGLSTKDWVTSTTTSTIDSSEVLSEAYRRPKQLFLHGQDGSITIELQNEEPSWLRPCIVKLEELLKLPLNWDSYGGLPVGLESTALTLQVLFDTMQNTTIPPVIVPICHGGIQLEWHTRGIDLEIEIKSPSYMHFSVEDPQNNIEWDGELKTDLDRLKNLICRLSE